MPSPEEMELSEEQKNYISEHLEQNTDLLTRGCPTCGNREFEVENILKYIPTVGTEGKVELEYGAPYTEVVCTKCQKVHLFHVGKIGLPGMDI